MGPVTAVMNDSDGYSTVLDVIECFTVLYSLEGEGSRVGEWVVNEH